MATVRELAGKIKIAGMLRHDEPMREHTSFRIGGPADLYVAPHDAQEVALILALCRRESVPWFLLGGGTNILVSDRGIRGVVVDITRLSRVEADGNLVTALCGAPISDVSELALSRGLSGLEFAYSLPGSVGGAVWMNARCYDREMSDVLEYVEYLDGDFSPRRRGIDRAEWGYKLSPFQKGRGVILRAALRLAPGDPAEIEARMREHREDRVNKGHFLFPCAGSVFKNNRAFGAPTGKLIDTLELKGRRIGDAQVAPFHGNIIINGGAATAAEVRSLIELVEEEVEKRLGFRLEREILLVGEW